MNCPHCQQDSLYTWFNRFDWCYKCGYDNDRRYPIRFADNQKQLDQMDRDIQMQAVALIRPDYCSHRWHDKPLKTMDEKQRHNREYQKAWREANKERLSAHRRERAKGFLSTGSIERVQK
jgi:Zn ribbon nucleic-acid-binding protein